jgi:hypothetical protein
LLHGQEREIFGDQAYWKEADRQGRSSQTHDLMTVRDQQLDDGDAERTGRTRHEDSHDA